MSNGTASLSVWVGDGLVCVKIAGRASFQCSVDFKTLINKLREQGHKRFVLEVSECQLMDSTFLGVLAGLGLKFSEERNGRDSASLELLNPNDRIFDLIENLGINHLFHFHKGAAPAAGELSPVGNPAGGPDRRETTRTCLEAHRLLMEINPANVAKFKDVTNFLEEDLKKQEKGSG
jgi:anti-anti-sigma regulatory factor